MLREPGVDEGLQGRILGGIGGADVEPGVLCGDAPRVESDLEEVGRAGVRVGLVDGAPSDAAFLSCVLVTADDQVGAVLAEGSEDALVLVDGEVGEADHHVGAALPERLRAGARDLDGILVTDDIRGRLLVGGEAEEADRESAAAEDDILGDLLGRDGGGAGGRLRKLDVGGDPAKGRFAEARREDRGPVVVEFVVAKRDDEARIEGLGAVEVVQGVDHLRALVFTGDERRKQEVSGVEEEEIRILLLEPPAQRADAGEAACAVRRGLHAVRVVDREDRAGAGASPREPGAGRRRGRGGVGSGGAPGDGGQGSGAEERAAAHRGRLPPPA